MITATRHQKAAKLAIQQMVATAITAWLAVSAVTAIAKLHMKMLPETRTPIASIAMIAKTTTTMVSATASAKTTTITEFATIKSAKTKMTTESATSKSAPMQMTTEFATSKSAQT